MLIYILLYLLLGIVLCYIDRVYLSKEKRAVTEWFIGVILWPLILVVILIMWLDETKI